MTRTEIERLAVVERDIKHLTERHEEFRDEVRGEFRSVKADFASVRDDVAEIKELLTQARGGLRVMRFGWGAFAKGCGLDWRDRRSRSVPMGKALRAAHGAAALKPVHTAGVLHEIDRRFSARTTLTGQKVATRGCGCWAGGLGMFGRLFGAALVIICAIGLYFSLGAPGLARPTAPRRLLRGEDRAAYRPWVGCSCRGRLRADCPTCGGAGISQGAD